MVRQTFDTVEEFWGAEDLQRAVDLASNSGPSIIGLFESRFIDYLGGTGTALFFPSGRAALRAALGILKSSRGKDVLVPAFCCEAVGEAIHQAGMRPLLIDSGTTVGSIDGSTCLEAIRGGDVCAVIIPHLFGLPLDLRPFLECARQRGVVVIEDCAHCLGGRIGNAQVGTLGDLSFFSFSYDKPISLGGGGLLVCNPDSPINQQSLNHLREFQWSTSPALTNEIKELEEFRKSLESRRAAISSPLPPHRRGLLRAARKALGNVYVRWAARQVIPYRFREGGAPLSGSVGLVRAALGLALLGKYPSVLARRNENYALLADQFSSQNVGSMMTASGQVTPAWLKAKLMVPESRQERIDALGEFLCSKGFRAGRFNWPRSQDQQVGLVFKARAVGSLRNAHRLARLSIDLPIHQNMEPSQLRQMASYVIAWLS